MVFWTDIPLRFSKPAVLTGTWTQCLSAHNDGDPKTTVASVHSSLKHGQPYKQWCSYSQTGTVVFSVSETSSSSTSSSWNKRHTQSLSNSWRNLFNISISQYNAIKSNTSKNDAIQRYAILAWKCPPFKYEFSWDSQSNFGQMLFHGTYGSQWESNPTQSGKESIAWTPK